MLGRNIWFATIFGIASLLVLRKVNAEPASRGLLVVANQKEHTVLVVDPDERRELAKVVVGVNGHEVMVSKDGRFAYVPIYGNSRRPPPSPTRAARVGEGGGRREWPRSNGLERRAICLRAIH